MEALNVSVVLDYIERNYIHSPIEFCMLFELGLWRPVFLAKQDYTPDKIVSAPCNTFFFTLNFNRVHNFLSADGINRS
jgi:hypothetical protein